MSKVKVTGAYVRVPGGVVMNGGVAEVEDADRLVSLGVAEIVPNSTPASPGVSTAPPVVTSASNLVDYSAATRAAAAEATGAEEPKALEDQTVTELRATAKEQGIAIPAEVKKKDDILALLRGDESEGDGTPDEATGAEGSAE